MSPPDWDEWLSLKDVLLWQACALSLNLDPLSMNFHPQAWMTGPGSDPIFEEDTFPSEEKRALFYKRLRVAKSNFGGASSSTGTSDIGYYDVRGMCVRLSEFVTWALALPTPWDMPEDLIKAPTKAKPQPPQDNLKQSRQLRQSAQEQAIVAQLKALGHDPKALPRTPKGKAGVRRDVRNAVRCDPIFRARTSFDKAWERVTQWGDIAYKE